MGYIIDKDEGNRYFLQMEALKGPEGLIDTEEAIFLQEMLWQTPASDPLRDKILHKLNKQFTLRPIVQSLVKLQAYEHIHTIGKAIEMGRRVRLHNYQSAEGELSTRHVEPVEFQQGYAYLLAYDLDKEDYRQFKIERIGLVEFLEEKIAGKHESRLPDLFGWTGKQWLPVKLRLSARAHQLLVEEYPDARPFIHSTRGKALFDGMVRDWRGIGRFVLGLPGEIEVVEPEVFREYLRERAEKAKW